MHDVTSKFLAIYSICVPIHYANLQTNKRQVYFALNFSVKEEPFGIASLNEPACS